MKRRVLCLILAVIMVACLLPTAAFASTNGKTADDAINWVKSLEGQPVGSGECVALIKAYYSYLGQTSPGGNGADYSWNQLPAGWQRLQNAQPQKGDILVYSGNAANPYGHVAIYESDKSTWHQNYAYQRKVVHVTNVRYNGFDNPYWGVIRPDFGSAVFKPDFINIGTNIYRYIIRADKWMPTGTCYDQNAKRDVKIVNSGSSDPNVIWLFTHMGFDNSYVIQNAYSNDYLCYEGNCASQAKITTSDKLTSKCYWYVAYYNGLCKLVAKDSVASGNWLVIDCKDGSSTPGTQLQLYGNWGPNDSNGNAQLFNIYTVENYQQPPKPPKVEITVPKVVTVGEEFTISWTASPLQGKYDQREYEVHIRKGGSGFKTIYTTDTSVTLTLTKPDTSYNVYLTVYNRKYQDYSSSAFATFRCIRETAHEHSYTAVVTAPTCTAKGYTTHTCSCGDSYVDTYTDALGHAWDNGKVTKPATETETGVKTFTCTRCSETKTEVIPALSHEHSYKAVVTAPTCTEKGYTTHTCSCGDSYVDTYVDALGHAWDGGTVTKQPTATETGIKTYTCTRCSATKTETIPAGGCPSAGFTDVPGEDNWAHAGIDYCVANGLMSGVGDNLFAPKMTTTRAQIVQILYNLEGEPKVSGTMPFTDLTQNWYKDAVLWAYQTGVVSGTSATTFAPDLPVTREQIAVILMGYAEKVLGVTRTWTPADLSVFPDAGSVSGWAKDALADAVALGLISGASNGGVTYLSPKGSATREQVATILMEFCKNVKK
ncbi:MAG TPA: S-layer homology domain-containing protein [Clostridiales bacterium]|nr:S-layer homology domain-containing protein [Clostridiales bacterium]